MAQVAQLFERVAQDSAFRQSLENAPDAEARKAIMTAAGFGDISKEEVEAYAADHGQELTDAELEVVAGGAGTSWASVILGVSALIVAALA